MSTLVNDHAPKDDKYRYLAVILDDELYMAPRINQAVFDSAQFVGDFSEEETEDLAAILGSGALPAVLRQIGRRDLGP